MATVVLKGAGTLVVTGDSLPYICDQGNPGMASPGMGDVLTGVITGIAAQTADLPGAARAGVLVHAMAGDMAARRGERGLLATGPIWIPAHVREPGTEILSVGSAEQMQVLGRAIGAAVDATDGTFIIALEGELGAGKTTLVGGILRSYGVTGPVRSPTYTLIEPYETASRAVYHLDLYRLTDPDEVEPLGHSRPADRIGPAAHRVAVAGRGLRFPPPTSGSISPIRRREPRVGRSD